MSSPYCGKGKEDEQGRNFAQEPLENHVQDERDKVISAQSTMVGMIGMTVIFLLLLVIRLLWKDGSLFDIGAMYFGYLAVAQFYQFALLRGKMRCFWLLGTRRWRCSIWLDISGKDRRWTRN